MKVLIIGLGKIAGVHIAALRSLRPDADVYALRSGACPTSVEGVTDIRALSGMPGKPDFVIISNPTGLHAAAIESVLDTGSPLFIEKPVFDSLDHGDLVERIERAGLKTYVACNLRFLDLLRYVGRYVADHPEKTVNEVNVYCGTWLPGYRDGGDYRASYNARPELGGGIHVDMIHDIDYVTAIFGMPRRVNALFRNVSSIGIEACDYANYTLEYPGFTASVILNYYRPKPRRTMEIVFDDTVITADMRLNVVTDSDGNVIYRGANTVADTYRRQMEYFIDAITFGKPIDNDARHACRILALALGQNPEN